MCLISIIVPVYNTQNYIEKCLDSLMGQTLPDIEIICIDDCSEDDSRVMLERIAKQDQRIKLISHSENQGTLQARRHGVNAAKGKYLMFVDSDDFLEPQTCENLYKHMCESDADVIQFGTKLHAAENVSDEMLQWVSNFLQPYPGYLYGRDILRKCFLEDKFDFNITDKIWKTELCRTSFDKAQHIRLSASEDRYLFFILAYYAKSYRGLQDEAYYNYNLGIGITGGDSLSFSQFQKRCSGQQAAEAVKQFLISEDALKDYSEEYERFSNLILWDCVHCWHKKLEEAYRPEGFRILKEHWSAAEIMSAIARMFFEDSESILKDIYAVTTDSKESDKFEDQSKTIAIYYRYLGYEPMNEYLQQYIDLCEQLGYSVVLYTDEDAQIQEVRKSFKNLILTLPSSADANWDRYSPRAKALESMLSERNVAAVLYMSPVSHIAWIDTLLMRTMGIPVIYANESVKLNQLELQSKIKQLEAINVQQEEVGRQQEESYKRLAEKDQQLEEINKRLKKIVQQLEEANKQLLTSREYRLGSLLLWGPKMILRCIRRIKGR